MSSEDQEGAIMDICETLVQWAISLNVNEIEKDEQPEQINSIKREARGIGRHPVIFVFWSTLPSPSNAYIHLVCKNFLNSRDSWPCLTMIASQKWEYEQICRFGCTGGDIRGVGGGAHSPCQLSRYSRRRTNSLSSRSLSRSVLGPQYWTRCLPP